MLDSQGNTTTPQYDANSDVSSVLTPINTDGTRAGGTPTSHRQGDDDHTSCSAFTGELCSQSNGNSKTTSYGYDALGRVTTLTQPAPLKPLQFTYDGASRLTSATDGRGNTAYYSYDANDRLMQVSYSATGCPVATCVIYSYDGNGNKTARSAATGATGYTYDRLNRPTTKTFNGSTVSAVTWDGASNMLSFTDAAGTVTYRYDPANLLSFLAEPGGSCPTPATPHRTPPSAPTSPTPTTTSANGCTTPTGRRSTCSTPGRAAQAARCRDQWWWGVGVAGLHLQQGRCRRRAAGLGD